MSLSFFKKWRLKLRWVVEEVKRTILQNTPKFCNAGLTSQPSHSDSKRYTRDAERYRFLVMFKENAAVVFRSWVYK